VITLEEVRASVESYLGMRWKAVVKVDQIEKIFGGASRETYKLMLTVDGAKRGIIVRRDPPSSLIDTERALEYGAYDRIFPTDIPVPEPLFLENDPAFLGQPFSVMVAIQGCITDPSLLLPDQKTSLGVQKYEILGNLAAKDPIELGFDAIMPVPLKEDCALEQLNYWQGVVNQDEIHPQPIAQAAIRWLHRNLPSEAEKISVVHGDYRTGNFLFNGGAEIKGILDWEMCHLGNPLEDLAWSLDPLWSWGEPGLAGKLIPVDEAISIWRETSGLACLEEDFLWWRIFVALKALAIWISSSEDFENGESKDGILATAGWVMTDRQNRILLDYLSPATAADSKEGAS
jgi:aminoglycoside phosphotransferase (APT) family kinase protein